MSFPNPFYQCTSNTKRKWGYTFDLTPQHLTVEQMQPLKYSYDRLSDDCVELLQKIAGQTKSSNDIKSSAKGQQESESFQEKPTSPFHQDLLSTFLSSHSTDPTLSKLYSELTTVPSWVSYPQLSRGQDVFYRYGGANLTGLAFQSLLGGLGAWRVVEVLSRTGGFKTPVARRRLYETTQFILQCTKNVDSLRVGGDGWKACVRVRFLHSLMRMRILKLAEADADYYDVKTLGIPSNDLDSIATIASFSSTLIWQSLPRQGLFLTMQEKEDYIALWRYVGYLLGTPTDGYLDTVPNARRILEVLILHEIEPSETSRILAHNMLAALTRVPPINASESMLAAQAHWLIGHELADALDIPRPSPYWYILMAGQCCFFMWSCYLARLWPALERRKQKFLRDSFWTMIVTSPTGLSGKEAKYEFKHIPRAGKITERMNREEKSQGTNVERRNLKAAIIAAMVVLSLLWLSWLAFKGIVTRLISK